MKIFTIADLYCGRCRAKLVHAIEGDVVTYRHDPIMPCADEGETLNIPIEAHVVDLGGVAAE